MKPFIGVIARGKSGKSTIIKSLTGCGSSNYRDFLKDNLTGETILVICGSPQEEQLSLVKLRELLKLAADDPNCRGVVIAIQPTRPRTRLSMEQIFDAVINCGGFQLNAFVLDPERNGEPANTEVIVSRLSQFDPRIQKLDGQRFAGINARIINDATSVVPSGVQEPTRVAAAAGGKK